MLNVGRIEYANCTPLFLELLPLLTDGGYTIESGVPSLLNRRLLEGTLDICPSSSVEYALNPGRYLILPDISISSPRAVRSVLLFSKIPAEQLDGKSVFLSAESSTSANLLKILLSGRYSANPHYTVTDLPFMSALESCDALLLIGDAALKGSMELPSNITVYDLGEIWNQWTSLPFVFALWLVNCDSWTAREDEIRGFHALLISAKKRASLRFDELSLHAPESAWIDSGDLACYWKNALSYDLGSEHLLGLKRFYDEAFSLGLVPVSPDFRFAC